MVIAFVAVLLVLLAVAGVAYPFFKQRGLQGEAAQSGHLQDLVDQRETLEKGINELENDRALGNLGAEEFQQLQEDYARQAEAIQRALDARANGLAKEIENEILAVRRRDHLE